MTLTINPDLESKLRERAAAEGRDPRVVAEEILQEGLAWVFDPTQDDDWRSVVKRRIAELDSGEVRGLPAEDVHARLRKLFA